MFKTTPKEIIVGGEVTKGKLTVPAKVRVMREKELVADVDAAKLQRALKK